MGSVLLDNVHCDGSETSLSDCSGISSWGNVPSYCSDHSRDAAAVCSDSKFTCAWNNF